MFSFCVDRKPASEHELPIFILLIYSILKAQSNYFSYQLVVYNREQKRHF